MFQLVMTPQMLLYLTLAIDNAISTAINTVSKMTPDEVAAGIIVEEARKKANIAELDTH